MDKCSSPPLIAAFHVLHRLEVPRHSPYALSSLTIKLAHKQNSLGEQIYLDLSNKILIETCFSSKIYSVVKNHFPTIVENKTL